MQTKKTIKKDITAFNKNNVTINESPNGYGLTYFTKRNFKKGEVIVKGFGRIISRQTEHFSVQIGYNAHFSPTKWTGKYWNHSCEPNCFVRTRPDGFPDLIALRNIKCGEEISYSYFMSERRWEKYANENKIACKCQSKKCFGMIRSFIQLSYKEQYLFKKKKYLSKYLY